MSDALDQIRAALCACSPVNAGAYLPLRAEALALLEGAVLLTREQMDDFDAEAQDYLKRLTEGR